MVKYLPFFRRLKCLAAALILSCNILEAQSFTEKGASAIALAQADLFLNNAWSASSNPAQISRTEKSSIGISYFSPFLLNSISSRNISASFPVKRSGFGLSYNQFGFEKYREHVASVAYSQSFSKSFSMGIQIKYLNTFIEEPYGSNISFSANFGLHTDITDRLSLAALIINPSRSKKDKEGNYSYPQKFRFGLKYDAFEYLQITVVATEEAFYPLGISFGINYFKADMFAIQLGYSNGEEQFSFGCSYQIRKLNIGFASAYNYQLGFSPIVSLEYTPSFKSNKGND